MVIIVMIRTTLFPKVSNGVKQGSWGDDVGENGYDGSGDADDENNNKLFHKISNGIEQGSWGDDVGEDGYDDSGDADDDNNNKLFPKVSNGVEQGSRRQRGAAGKSSSKWSTHRGTGRLILMVIRNN